MSLHRGSSEEERCISEGVLEVRWQNTPTVCLGEIRYHEREFKLQVQDEVIKDKVEGTILFLVVREYFLGLMGGMDH
jgi:hypothetical protein